MKNTRRPGTEKTNGLWKNLTSGILNKVNKNNISNKQNEDRDMGDTHTPLSRLDLTGLNREQAKEMINKIIDERLEMISHIELTELKIDYREKERQRAKAAERINERRSRRKTQGAAPEETIVTEQGVYSNYKHASVFDVIQPETFPFEESKTAPIEGQLSILEALTAAEKTAEPSMSTEFAESFDLEEMDQIKNNADRDELIETVQAADPAESVKFEEAAGFEEFAEAAESEEFAEAEESVELAEAAEPEKFTEAAEPAADGEPYQNSGFDFFGLLQYDSSKEGVTEEEAKKLSVLEGVQVSTALDEALDKVFSFYEKSRRRVLQLCQKTQHSIAGFLRIKVIPAASAAFEWVSGKLLPLLQKLDSRLQLRNKTAVVLAALAKREKKASEKMVLFIDFIDRVNEAFLNGMAVLKEKVCRRVNLIRDYAEHHKKKVLIGFGIGVAGAAMVTIIIGNMTAYEYIYSGKVLGVVKYQEDVYKTIDVIGDKLSAQYDADITIDKKKDIRFKKIVAFNQDIDDRDDILNRLTYMRDMKVNGRGIFVDSKLVAVLESDKTARAILNEIQDNYVKEDANIQYKEIGFAEDVTIKDVETKLGNIEAKDKALEYMLTGAVEKKIHQVQSGETFSEIAKIYGLKQSELQTSNPDIIPEKLSIGQEICLNQIVPLVTVQTTEVAQYKEAIPYEIKYENTANLFKNEQTVKTKGANGEKDVVAEIVRNNGIEVSRSEISATVLSEPVSQVVMVGTKEPPPLIGTGSFIYPIRGTLTSRYGTRWGRLHAGIDLAAPIGTHIKAADGGKVTFSGYNGALGYMVAIDHGGGRVTWYGHCSKLFVKKGDRVYQGQHIANVGNTGRSTGPHVHFEVHINGKTKNPLSYL